MLACGCETVVDVQPPQRSPELVVQTFFTNGGAWVVRVSESVPFASNLSPSAVQGARVVLLEDGIEIGQAAPAVAPDTTLTVLPKPPPGTYIATTKSPVEGKAYGVAVTADGFESTVGADILPPAVPVANSTISLVADSSSLRRRVEANVTLQDPAPAENYYGLIVVQARWSEDRRTGEIRPLSPSLFTFRSDDIVLGEGDFDFISTEKSVYGEAFFTDELFSGIEHTLSFGIEFDAPREASVVVIRRAFFAVLLSVTSDFFRYWESAGAQAFANENPFAEPVTVHSNMTRGYGIVGGFRYHVIPLSIDGAARFGPVTLDELCTRIGVFIPVESPVFCG